MSKYNNIKCGNYDSRKEARRGAELEFLEKKNIIHSLQKQVKFQLIPSQKDDKGKVIERSVCYKADFKYVLTRSNEWIVEDVKGMKTKDYIIKRKLMLYIHGIRVKEI